MNKGRLEYASGCIHTDLLYHDDHLQQMLPTTKSAFSKKAGRGFRPCLVFRQRFVRAADNDERTFAIDCHGRSERTRGNLALNDS